MHIAKHTGARIPTQSGSLCGRFQVQPNRNDVRKPLAETLAHVDESTVCADCFKWMNAAAALLWALGETTAGRQVWDENVALHDRLEQADERIARLRDDKAELLAEVAQLREQQREDAA